MSQVKAKRRQTVVDKTKNFKENQFFYRETFYGDSSSDENSSNSDEDTESLFRRARNLVNEEFRLMSLNSQDFPETTENLNMTPKQSYKELSVKKKIESVNNARKQIQQEWNALKNASMMNDSNTIGDQMDDRPRDPQKDALRGVVIYIEVRPSKKLVDSLRSILKSMGATILNNYTQEVTHIVFKNGSEETFKRAKLLNTFLVSVLWVEACKNAGYKISERLFPVVFTNKYCNSPRVFRKYLESRKEHQNLACDLFPIEQLKPQSNIHNPRLNHNENGDNTNLGATYSDDISGITMFKEPNTKGVAVEHNNYSDDEIHLHLSSDDSKSNESNDHSNSVSPDDKINNERTSPVNCLKTIPVETENNEIPVILKNTSPFKRKLFQKFPLQASFVSYDRDSTDSLKLTVNNPYQISNAKHNKSRRIDVTDESLVANKSGGSKSTDTKQTTDSNQPPLRKKKSPIKKDSIFKPLRISGRSPRKNYLPQKCWPKLVSTSLHSYENRSLERCISRLGNFRLGHKVDKFTTHVVAGGSHRTVNLLKAVARGCWVVNKDWVLQSEIAGHWVTEDVYELGEFSKVVRRSRIQKQVLGKDFSLEIFDECGHIFISQDSQPPWKDLQELVVLCGGKVTSILDTANIVVGAIEGATQRCVSVKWILDSITYGRSKSLHNYYL